MKALQVVSSHTGLMGNHTMPAGQAGDLAVLYIGARWLSGQVAVGEVTSGGWTQIPGYWPGGAIASMSGMYYARILTPDFQGGSPFSVNVAGTRTGASMGLIVLRANAPIKSAIFEHRGAEGTANDPSPQTLPVDASDEACAAIGTFQSTASYTASMSPQDGQLVSDDTQCIVRMSYKTWPIGRGATQAVVDMGDVNSQIMTSLLVRPLGKGSGLIVA